MPSSISSIPLANIDELNELWKADKRLPTLSSRREWARARNLKPTIVNEWWWVKRKKARDRRDALSCENYQLPIGNPPETALMKLEPVDEDLKLITLDSSRCTSPRNDTPSISLELSSEDSNLSSYLFSSERLDPESPQTSIATIPSSEQDDTKNMDICARVDEKDCVSEDLPSCRLRLSPEFFQSHEQSATCAPEDVLDEDAEVMLVDVGSSASISRPIQPWQPKLWPTPSSSPRYSPSVQPSPYSVLSLDGKIFTRNGFHLAHTTKAEEPELHLVKTSTKPCDFPLLSVWSDSHYLPPHA